MSIFGGGKQPASKTPSKALGIDFQGAQYGPPIPVVYGQNKVAGNCIWYGDFQAIAVQQKQSGGKGGGGSSSTTSYNYKASYQLGLCEGPGSIVQVYNGTSTVSLSALGAVSASGTQGQAPWAHLTGSAALGYSGTVLVSFQNRDLGSSASLPNDNFEVAGLLQYGGGIVDANPKDIITDICTNVYHGINFGMLGDLTQCSNYWIASGIFFSPVYDQQQSANQTISDLLKYGNADAWFSEGELKFGCYGDETITGNGVTYTPNNTAVANLGYDDFITNGNTPPVTITRKAAADAMNIERLEYVDRSNTYHTSAVTATFDNDIVSSGARGDASDTFHGITSAAVARLVAQNILQRQFYVRNQYAFQLSWRYCYLEPFDIVTLTDVNTGLNSYPVRILSVEEDEAGLLKFTAEEFPLGIGHGGTYNTTPNSGTTVDPNADPGPVAAPYLFRGPGFLVSNNTPEIWCAVTGNGNPLWAGCDVYLSHDGTSYTFVSTYARQARYGELTNSMGVQPDPDTTSAPNVVLNGYNTQLLGGSSADADNFTTLAMVDNEIIAYETATLGSGPSYTLGYLRRGGYGSAIAAHSVGAPFVRLDDGILRIPVDPSQIGQTVYIKFLSRNCFGRTPRTLAGETAYTYVVGTNVELPDVPNVPDSFAVLPVADGVSITWTNDNPAAVGCTSIEYATASGGPWTVLAQVGPTTTSHHHAFTSGSTYYYRARARGPLVQSGWSAYTSVLSSTGVNVSGTGGLVTTVNSNQPLITNPYFSTGDLTGWTSDNGTWAFQSGSTNNPTPASTTYAIRTGSSGTPNDVLRNACKIPVYPGAQIKAQCLVRGIGSPNGTCGVRISWRDGSDSELSVTAGNTTTGTATNGTYVTAAAPSGAVYAHVECQALGHTTGSYSVDNFWASSTVDNLDNVPDSATRFASPLSQAIILAGNTPGGNMVPNPMFALGLLDWTAGSGWFASNYQGESIAAISLTGTPTTSVLTSTQLPISAGVALSVGLDLFAGCTFTAGDVSADISYYNSGGTLISRSSRIFTVSSIMSAFARRSLANTVTPSGCAYAQVRIYIEAASGSGALFVKRIKVERGAVCTPWNDDATQFGNQLTNAGSGQQTGDLRNLNMVGVGSLRSAWNNAPSYSATSGTTAHATISFPASTLTLGAVSVSYSAMSVSVTGTGGTNVQYWLYFDDPTYAGGSQTLVATTNSNDVVAGNGRVYVGNVTVSFPTSGTGGGGGGSGGGGCVAADQWMLRGDGTPARAGDIQPGDVILGCDESREGYEPLIVESAEHSMEPCLRLTVGENAVTASVHTPMTLIDGLRAMLPDNIPGTSACSGDGERCEWRTVRTLAPVGDREVVRIRVGGRRYWAGEKPGAYILTHNPIK